ncbi:hypothetical protein C0Q70_18795 [Pomacea canaliculata]|uniref:Uncharacterized protein n=1 Tax=Pomacea canaliculata TaxID=400727 RepID=A0A2T7NHH9_POMCA|nr:hypothetical protein C0Q70_18795 [Pomacea canaliculata]
MESPFSTSGLANSRSRLVSVGEGETRRRRTRGQRECRLILAITSALTDGIAIVSQPTLVTINMSRSALITNYLFTASRSAGALQMAPEIQPTDLRGSQGEIREIVNT